MLNFLIGALVGFAIGTIFGVVITALMVAAGRDKD